MFAFAFHKNGTLEPPPQAALEAADDDTLIITYTTGKLADGRPYYAFISVKPSRYKAFNDAMKSKKPVCLKDYGDILACDFTEQPSAEVISHMHKAYGYNDNFMPKLQDELTKQRLAYNAMQEEIRLGDIVKKLKSAT